jgi:hypothetical protein
MIKRVLMFIQMCGVASLLFFPAEIYAACDLLADGSFEATTPDGDNSFWTQTSTNFTGPLCDASCVDEGGLGAPRTGKWWAWFGGTNKEEDATLIQESVPPTPGVLIPADTLPRLNFYLWNPVTSDTGVGVDFLSVTVDGVEVFNMKAGNPLYTGDYTLVDLDLNPYADGGCHTLKLEGKTFASSSITNITNIFVDDVAIVCSAVRIGATPYASIQAAMDVAGDHELSATAHLFPGDLLFSQTGTVTFKGGYDCKFFQNPGYTTIGGKVTVDGTGTLIAENVIISNS